MTASPNTATDGAIQAIVYSNNQDVSGDASILSISVCRALNRVPRARIVLDDGEVAKQKFAVSSSDLFKPGAAIRVDAGYGSARDRIFDGIVVRHGISITHGNRSRLVVDCRDRAISMTASRRNANFSNMSDSDVISKIIAGYASVELTSRIEKTALIYGELVQYYCTDWDYLVCRAEIAGQVVNVKFGEVTTATPKAGDATLRVQWGDSLMEFHGDIDARTQYSSVKSVSWDHEQQAVISETCAPVEIAKHGDLDSAMLAQNVGNTELLFQTPAAASKEVLGIWAKSQQTKSALARVKGSMKFQGSASAEPGGTIKLEGVGTRFSGNVYVTAVTHEIANGQWTTEAEFGMSSNWFAQGNDVAAPPASGVSPGAGGLQVGVVQQLDEDPDGEYRIKVNVPVLQAEAAGVWARLASPYASSGFGACFVPEVGDEVVLGYFNEDPGTPVVIGSLYSSSRKPPFVEGDNRTFEGTNRKKGFVTRKNIRMEFDEDDGVVSILTPGENKLVMNDAQKTIVMSDKMGNSVMLDESGISLKSMKDITIDAAKKVTITGGGGVSIGTAIANTVIKGQRVDIN